MHIAFFSDQHPATLGGLQVSLGLQRKYLEAAGHTVTVCAPQARRLPSPRHSRPHDVLVPSQQFGDHAFYFPGLRSDRMTDATFSTLPPVDVVHVQADVWGAWSGYRFARRYGLPVVHTMHSNVEVGLPAVVPFARAGFRLLYAQQQKHLRTGPVRDMAGYVRAFSQAADTLIVPSSHFAQRLRAHGVEEDFHIVPTGVDDDQVGSVLAQPRLPRPRPVLLWPGRVSKEKQLDDMIRAFALSGLDAELHVYGTGPDLQRCQMLSEQLRVDHRVRFRGTVAHDTMLKAMRQADAVVQSSLGFETQGLTVYEAIAVGTPALVRDPNIAQELPELWHQPVADSSIDALAVGLQKLPALFAGGEVSGLRGTHSQFSQSRLTARIIKIYQRTLAEYRHGKDQTRQELFAA